MTPSPPKGSPAQPRDDAMGPAPDVADRERIRAEARAKLFGEPRPNHEPSAPSDAALDDATQLPDGSTASADDEDPTDIGRFRTLGRLGEGGMGVVYSAYDPELDRRVALKLLRPDLAGVGSRGTSGTARLQREAQAMARLNHPNVVTVHEVGRHAEQVFVAMEFVKGRTLREWIDDEDDWREIVRIYCEAAQGLAAAHEAGIVHRDFKPDNVMVGDDGRVRVMDFGLSRADISSQETLPDEEPSSKPLALTQTGSIMGTPAYMAPEQHNAHTTTPATDQFAFCVALWEALAGERPFAGTTYPQLAGNVATGRIRAVPGSVSAPRRVFEALRRGLQVKPAERFPSMHELANALLADPTRRLKWIAAGAGVVALFGGIAYWASTRTTSPTDACDSADDPITQAWTAERKQAIEQAIERSGAAYAGTTWSTVETMLDRYATQWAEAARTSCAAKLLDEQDEIDLRRAQCIEARRHDFIQIVDVLAGAQKGLAQQAVQTVATLTPIESCADPRRLEAFSIVRDPESLRELSEARARLARAKARGGLGHHEEALSEADAVVEIGRALDDPATVAVGLLVRGQFEERTGDRASAEKTLRASIKQAELAHDHTTRALSLIRLIYVVGSDAKRYDEAITLGADVGAVLRMLGADPLLSAKLDSNLGATERTAGNYDTAIERYESAIATYEAIYADGHPETARALTSLASALISANQSERAIVALERARTSFETSLGKEHPFVAVVMGNLGTAYGRQRNFDAAIETLQAALELRRRSDGESHPGVARTLYNLGTVQHRSGRYAEAIRSLQEGEAILRESSPDSTRLARYRLMTGAAMVADGQLDKGRKVLEPLLRQFPVQSGPAGDNARRLRYELAITYIADDLQRARTLVEMSLESSNEQDSVRDSLANMMWLLDTVQYGPNVTPQMLERYSTTQ